MIYAARYGSAGATGYVYLPGRGEPNCGVNNGTIIRGDADGKWHVATSAWTAPERRDRDLRMIYGLRYCIAENGGRGSVHLAGRSDKFGAENVQRVWDGRYARKWRRSTPSWNVFFEHEVADQKK